MSDVHLTDGEMELLLAEELDEPARLRTDGHIAACPACRRRVAQERRFEGGLSQLSRAEAPRDLAARIGAAADLRIAQEQRRRTRLPFLVAAMVFSILLTIWFALQILVAIQVDGAVEFLSLLANRPDVFSSYTGDALLALLESLPISEILLTLCAVLTVVVLAQQWVDTAQPGWSVSRREEQS